MKVQHLFLHEHFQYRIPLQQSLQESLDCLRICLSPNPKFVSLVRDLGSHGPASTPVTLVSAEEDLSKPALEFFAT
ncbi:LAMI_0E05116g1_1 [Lachancea mirantina]|uniref:LAMI_0E05116g1_1 n=1 Tax=Lachancea mirantina TaxID=1230905 RepID=A0A1G4JL57_9SACH|nr:LAMI_0E05116g1_1 [Lachancea mirantina]